MPETTSAPAASAAAPVVKEAADATISEPAADSAVDMTLPAGEKMLSILGYIGFLCVLPIVLKPKSEMCQHHGKQALAVTLLFFLASAIVYNLGMLFKMQTLLTFSVIVNVAWVAVAILGIMGAAAGKKTSLPFFGSVAKKFDW